MAVKASNQVSLVDITDAYSVMLTSEAFTFVGDTSGAPSGLSCATQAVAYRGSTQCSNVSIGTITCPTGISATISNNNTESPIIIFKTTATITDACEATIPVVVDGITINKKFSFAVAMKGDAGNLDDLNVTEKLNSELKVDGNSIALTTGHFTINAANMKLDANGNAEFSGKLNAATGAFSGTISGSSGEFTEGFYVNILDPVSEIPGDDSSWRMSIAQNDMFIGRRVYEEISVDPPYDKYGSNVRMQNGSFNANAGQRLRLNCNGSFIDINDANNTYTLQSNTGASIALGSDVTISGNNVVINATESFTYKTPSITTNLNTLKKSGKWYCVNCSNRPFSENGFVEVTNNGSVCLQEYTCLRGIKMRRVCTSSGWDKWYDSGNVIATSHPRIRIHGGTIVTTEYAGATSCKFLAFSTLNSAFGVTNSNAANTAVFVSNGDGNATGVHFDGTTALNNYWWCTFGSSLESTRQIRINWMAVYFG